MRPLLVLYTRALLPSAVLLAAVGLSGCTVSSPGAQPNPVVPLGWVFDREPEMQGVVVGGIGYGVVVGPQYLLSTRHQFVSTSGKEALDEFESRWLFAGGPPDGSWDSGFRPAYLRARSASDPSSDLLLIGVGGGIRSDNGRLEDVLVAPAVWPQRAELVGVGAPVPSIGQVVSVVVLGNGGAPELFSAQTPTPKARWVVHAGRVVDIPPPAPRPAGSTENDKPLPIPSRAFGIELSQGVPDFNESTGFHGWSGAGVYAGADGNGALIGIIIQEGSITVNDGGFPSDDQTILIAESPDWRELAPDGPAWPKPAKKIQP